MSEPDLSQPEHWPGAAKAQLHRDQLEWRLVDKARKTHPRVGWWWGTRQGGRRSGAYCYLCELYIALWPAGFQPPEPDRQRIDRHRRHHLNTLIKNGDTTP